MSLSLQSRYRGVLLGLAAGDALGTTLEFKSPGTFAPITDMLGGGPFGLAPGQWTDDTSMALCLAESLVDCRGFNPRDQMDRYVRWWREGYRSSTGTCFDIGNTVRTALHRYQDTGEPYSGSEDPNSAGNGSLMRLGPIPLAYRADPALALVMASDSSRTTHGTIECLDACRAWTALLLAALEGWTREDLCSRPWRELPGFGSDSELAPAIARVLQGSYRERQPPHIRGTGYVVESLEAALWAFHRSDSFEAGALLAANLGDDADTTAAIYGQLAGACYGEEGIPRRWRACLTDLELIEALADQLLELAGRESSHGPH
ncbi:MAG: ADP-ribosylglycohydrolase family protein [Xanthomonadaceae bacterium]|nr:ADP-ribosylglycohydrolase family protein [Xanthomonadaceae bacterium]